MAGRGQLDFAALRANLKKSGKKKPASTPPAFRPTPAGKKTPAPPKVAGKKAPPPRALVKKQTRRPAPPKSGTRAAPPRTKFDQSKRPPPASRPLPPSKNKTNSAPPLPRSSSLHKHASFSKKTPPPRPRASLTKKNVPPPKTSSANKALPPKPSSIKKVATPPKKHFPIPKMGSPPKKLKAVATPITSPSDNGSYTMDLKKPAEVIDFTKFQGIYKKKNGKTVHIQRNKVVWSNGREDPIDLDANTYKNGIFMLELPSGQFAGRVVESNGTLTIKWTDGDVWQKIIPPRTLKRHPQTYQKDISVDDQIAPALRNTPTKPQRPESKRKTTGPPKRPPPKTRPVPIARSNTAHNIFEKKDKPPTPPPRKPSRKVPESKNNKPSVILGGKPNAFLQAQTNRTHKLSNYDEFEEFPKSALQNVSPRSRDGSANSDSTVLEAYGPTRTTAPPANNFSSSISTKNTSPPIHQQTRTNPTALTPPTAPKPPSARHSLKKKPIAISKKSPAPKKPSIPVIEQANKCLHSTPKVPPTRGGPKKPIRKIVKRPPPPSSSSSSKIRTAPPKPRKDPRKISVHKPRPPAPAVKKPARPAPPGKRAAPPPRGESSGASKLPPSKGGISAAMLMGGASHLKKPSENPRPEKPKPKKSGFNPADLLKQRAKLQAAKEIPDNPAPAEDEKETNISSMMNNFRSRMRADSTDSVSTVNSDWDD